MESLLLKNGITIDLNNGDEIKRDILISNGKIKEVSKAIKCEDKGLRNLDLQEAYVLPGFIDCHTHLGIIEEATGKIGVDNNEISNPVTPQLRGIDAINPMDIAFNDALYSGITSVMSGPGSNNAVGGLNCVIKTRGRIIDKMVVKNPSGFKIALGENPLSTYGVDKKCPVTRMATASLIRELFMRTQDYIDKKERGRLEERDIKLEAVIPLLKGEIPLRAHAHRADDIVTAIRIAEEFNIKKLVIEHGTEANIIKDYLREKSVPVAFGPMLTPRIKMELRRRHYSAALELAEAGVKVAMITDHPFNSIDQLRTVTILAVSQGLSKLDAIRSITVHPAEILDCKGRIGELVKGNDADIVVFDKHPLDIMSKVQMTIVDGSIVYNKDSNI